MKIIKRDKSTFNTDLIDNLEKKYPKCNKRTNQEYKRNLDYIAYNVDFHETDEFDTMIEHGYDTVLFYQFVRARIGAGVNGYKIDITGKKLKTLLRNACHYLHISEERANEIYKYLIEQKILMEIEYNNATWLLDEYSVWNFEIINSVRVASRKSTAQSRENTQNEQQKPKETTSDTQYGVQSLETEEVPAGFWDDLPPGEELPFT